jgi:hypothetical protein
MQFASHSRRLFGQERPQEVFVPVALLMAVLIHK